MNNNQSSKLLEMILEEIQLPGYIYEQAEKRYKDIGFWLENNPDIQRFSPSVFSQGSFRLGTAVKPVGREDFDLDLVCNIQSGFSKQRNTQKYFKEFVGNSLNCYKIERGIKEDLTEKRRCWRLIYADQLKFHMDILPCIPEVTNTTPVSGFDEHRVSITDNQSPFYFEVNDDWLVSNPEGFALWFESKMNSNQKHLVEHSEKLGLHIDEFVNLPYYQWKTPLQKSIQLLKRHRDIMFLDNQDSKPISIIITTLAARAYQGESDVAMAITNILDRMNMFVYDSEPHVPNPVDPDEDFADKRVSNPELRHNFVRWIAQAQANILTICSQNNRQVIIDSINKGFELRLSKSSIDRTLGLGTTSVPITNIITDRSKPWLEN